MRKYLHLSGALVGLCLGAGCANHHVDVEARSEALTAHEGEAGHLNAAAYNVGDIVEVDLVSQKVWKAGAVQVNAFDLAYSQPGKQACDETEPAYTLAYSQKVHPELKEEVSGDVQSGTKLHVENYWTRSLKNPALFVLGSDQVTKRVAKLHAEHPGNRFYLVSAVSSADKVYLACDAGKDNTVEAGKYDFHVGYSQNAGLAKLAKEKPAFFKLTPLKMADDESRTFVAVDNEASDKIADAKVGDAVASSW